MGWFNGIFTAEIYKINGGMSAIENATEEFIYFLSKRDLTNLVGLFSDDIEWEVPGNEKRAEWLGKRNSKDEIEQFFKVLWATTEPISAAIHKIFVEKNDVVITGEFSTKMLKTNKVVDSIFFIHMVVKDQKIIKYKLLEDSYAVSEALR